VIRRGYPRGRRARHLTPIPLGSRIAIIAASGVVVTVAGTSDRALGSIGSALSRFFHQQSRAG